MISDTLKKNLLAIAAAYARATGATPGQMSFRFYGNTLFFDEFKRGKRSISLDKFDEMVAQFAAEWPDGAQWPDLPPAVITRRKSVNRSA
jgi:hypothetical protein